MYVGILIAVFVGCTALIINIVKPPRFIARISKKLKMVGLIYAAIIMLLTVIQLVISYNDSF